MYNLMLDFFRLFGLDIFPATFGELIPWLISVFIALFFVIYIFNLVFILVKNIGKKGGM